MLTRVSDLPEQVEITGSSPRVCCCQSAVPSQTLAGYASSLLVIEINSPPAASSGPPLFTLHTPAQPYFRRARARSAGGLSEAAEAALASFPNFRIQLELVQY